MLVCMSPETECSFQAGCLKCYNHAGHSGDGWASQSSSGGHRAEHCNWANQVSVLPCLEKTWVSALTTLSHLTSVIMLVCAR